MAARRNVYALSDCRMDVLYDDGGGDEVIASIGTYSFAITAP
jgi:hypothetical protein